MVSADIKSCAASLLKSYLCPVVHYTICKKYLLNINRDTYVWCMCVYMRVHARARASFLYLACNDRFDKVSVNSAGYGSNARNMAAGNGVYLEHLCT